jgi:2-dehydropantoate 2-reductase
MGFDGFAPASFAADAPEAAALRSVADLASFNRTSAKTHSGIWRDLAVHHRRTEVDAQIAVIAELGTELGVATPAIRRLVSLVHDVEDGRRPQSFETFGELMVVCS